MCRRHQAPAPMMVFFLVSFSVALFVWSPFYLAHIPVAIPVFLHSCMLADVARHKGDVLIPLQMHSTRMELAIHVFSLTFAQVCGMSFLSSSRYRSCIYSSYSGIGKAVN